MRLFIAVNIPDEIKESLFAFQQELKLSLGEVKWINKDQFHLTLKFLGETEENKIENIINGISKAVLKSKPFKLSFSGAGVFPDINKPRVIWAGTGAGKEELLKIAQEIEENLNPLGFQKDKREFSAHLTLGRFRPFKNKATVINKIIEKDKTRLGSFKVKSVELIQSILHPGGPEYKCIKSISI